MVLLQRQIFPIYTLLFILTMVSCDNGSQAADCQQWMKGIEAIGKTSADNLQVYSLKSKQDHITFLHTMADGETKNNQILEALILNDTKMKEFRKQFIEASQEISQAYRDSANKIKSLPGEPDLQTIKAAIKPFEQNILIASKQLSTASNGVNNYCKWNTSQNN